MTAYFMTWDFNRASDFLEAAIFQERCGRGETISRRWSTGVRKNMPVGSTLIMVRQGRKPRGIIGIGLSKSEPAPHQRHDDPSREGMYAKTEWSYMFVEPVISESALPDRFHGMLSGGWIIEEELASRLLAEFETNRPRNDTEIVQSIDKDVAISATEREALVRARTGQGRFRENLMKIEPRCRITKITTPEFLRASHIKPWRSCSDNAERLDGNNGLLLTPNADHLFDRGLITFGDDGEIIFSSAVAAEDIQQMGIVAGSNVGPFTSQQCKYLDYHRQHVFLRN